MDLKTALPRSNRQVMVQAIGRLLYQASFGLMSFYIPLLFVNQMGFSATAVGFSLSLISFTEVMGHLIGGTLADASITGRKTVLSLSAGLGMATAMVLLLADNLWMLVLASLILGVSLGFYWTASGAAVMDATNPEDRPQAFAILGVTEYVGIGAGILGGSLLLNLFRESPTLLFVSCGITFLAVLVLVQLAMDDAKQFHTHGENSSQGILIALKDRALIVFMLANIFFTTYFALMTSAVPLYFTNFVAGIDSLPGVSVGSTANLFTWFYVGVGAVLQIPVTNLLTPFRRIYVLIGAMLLWATGFTLLWVTGAFAQAQFVWGIAALCLLSIGSIAYKPFFITIISDLAPSTLRGAYIAVSSQCWTIGYFIGPLLGGWAMDQSPLVAHRFWLAVAMSTLASIGLLGLFETLHGNSNAQAVALLESEG